MKNICLTSIFLFSLTFHCVGQNNGQNVDVLKKTVSVLNVITLNSGKVLTTKDLIMGSSQIEKTDVIMEQDKIKQNYPDSKFDAIVTYTLKPNVNLVGLKQLLDKYKIAPQYRNYKILYEDTEVEDPNNLLVCLDEVQDVVINKDRQYINIISKTYGTTLRLRKDGKAERERMKLWHDSVYNKK